MYCDILSKEKYSTEDLLNIFKILRSPNGCEWDREQTHDSIRQDFIEECYEAIEAIDTNDTELLKEELGDVLLQVIFHCEIEKELGTFDFSDIVNDLAKKLVQRHPHVFGSVSVSGTDDILSNWDKIKQESKGQTSKKEALISTTKALPAVMRYQKFLKKAVKWELLEPKPEYNFNIAKVNPSTDEIINALSNVIQIAQLNGVDVERELDKFTTKEIEKIEK